MKALQEGLGAGWGLDDSPPRNRDTDATKRHALHRAGLLEAATEWKAVRTWAAFLQARTVAPLNIQTQNEKVVLDLVVVPHLRRQISEQIVVLISMFRIRYRRKKEHIVIMLPLSRSV